MMPDGLLDDRMPAEQSKQLNARNSSGLKVQAMTFPNASGVLTYHGYHLRDLIYDGKEVVVKDPLKTVETHAYPNQASDDALRSYAARERHCVTSTNRKFIGYQMISGIRAAHLVGESVEENWEGWAWEEADCAMLEEKHIWKNQDGSLMSITVNRLDSVVIGEPDPALFEIPSDYTEKPAAKIEKP